MHHGHTQSHGRIMPRMPCSCSGWYIQLRAFVAGPMSNRVILSEGVKQIQIISFITLLQARKQSSLLDIKDEYLERDFQVLPAPCLHIRVESAKMCEVLATDCKQTSWHRGRPKILYFDAYRLKLSCNMSQDVLTKGEQYENFVVPNAAAMSSHEQP